MKIAIGSFKSIGETLELNLAPLTMLLGPPASGKSNILDAIALAGYFNRLLLLNEEYGNNVANFEPLQLIARFDDYPQLFTHTHLGKEATIAIEGRERIKLITKIFYKEGKFNMEINDTPIPWDLRNLSSVPFQTLSNLLKRAENEKLFCEARLYGYDRYGLSSSTDTSPTNCGFHLRLKGRQVRQAPVNILSEFGWNAPTVIKSTPDVIISLNKVLRDILYEEVEIRVLRSGIVVIFDYNYEIDSTAVSDSIFRILYYAIAMRSAINYVKFHGLENRFILLLEEPEAHIFPYFLDLLAEYISDSIKTFYVILTTHNPILVSKLWDKIKDVRTYYTFRNSNGMTDFIELSIEYLAEEIKTAEDILYMPPKEVIEKYSVSDNKRGE